MNILRAEFSNGYTSAAPNGLNHIRQTVSLRWDGLTKAQYLEILFFFEERGGHKPFSYQPRGFAEPHKWTAPEWSGSDSSPWVFEAQLVQWFGAVAV